MKISGLISVLKHVITRTDSWANSNSGVNSGSVSGANYDSGADSDYWWVKLAKNRSRLRVVRYRLKPPGVIRRWNYPESREVGIVLCRSRQESAGGDLRNKRPIYEVQKHNEMPDNKHLALDSSNWLRSIVGEYLVMLLTFCRTGFITLHFCLHARKKKNQFNCNFIIYFKLKKSLK